MKYHYFASVLTSHSEEMRKLQHKLSDKEWDVPKNTFDEGEAIIGKALSGSVESLNIAIFEMARKDQNYYQESANMARDTFKKAFGDRGKVLWLTNLEFQVPEGEKDDF